MSQSTPTPATTETTPTTATTPAAERGIAHAGEPATVGRVVRDQRKIVYLGLAFVVASFWILGQLGRWELGLSIALGVVLAVVNHLATEFWLLRLITSGRQATRGELTSATLVRLAVLTVVAVGLAVLLWPNGIGLLLGLAIFRLVALMMTSLTLLKELKSE